MAEEVHILLTRVGQTFPVGTVVGLYPGLVPDAGVPRPVGVAVASATVSAEESLDFGTIAVTQRTYWAAAQVGGLWRSIQATVKAGETPAVIGVGERGPKGDKGDTGAAGGAILAEEQVETKHLKAAAVTNPKIGLKAVGAENLNDESVVATKISGEAVEESKLKALAVSTAKLAAACVTAAKMGAEAIETAAIKALAVTTAKLAEGAVTSIKLGAESVETGKIKLLAITEGLLAAEAVAEGKIKNLAVGTAKIAANAVTGAKIAEATITGAKIVLATITDSLLAKPVIAGVVKANGEKEAGEGFTCERTAEGQYKITYNTEFATLPSLVVVASPASGENIVAHTFEAGKKTAKVITAVSTTGTLKDSIFHFHVKAT